MLQNSEVHETKRNRTAERNLKEKKKNTLCGFYHCLHEDSLALHIVTVN